MPIFNKKTESDTAAKVAASFTGSSDGKAVGQLFIFPRISEKAARLADNNKYVFNVPLSSNKVEIKKAVERTYKVKVLEVNIIKNQGKKVNFGRFSGVRSPLKKAVVTLKAGDKIEFITPTK